MTAYTADDTFKRLKGYTFEEVDELLQTAYLEFISTAKPKPSIMDWITHRDNLLLKTNWSPRQYIDEKRKYY